MDNKRIALVTGANQGVGFQVAKELVAHGLTVFVGARVLERGEAAAKEIGAGAIALQLDVTDRASIEAAAAHIRRGSWTPRSPDQQRRDIEHDERHDVARGVRRGDKGEHRVTG